MSGAMIALVVAGSIAALIAAIWLVTKVTGKNPITGAPANGSKPGTPASGGVPGVTPPYYVGTATDGRNPNPTNPPVTDPGTLSNYHAVLAAIVANSATLPGGELTATIYAQLQQAGVPQGFAGIAPLPALGSGTGGQTGSTGTPQINWVQLATTAATLA